jgi:ferrous iron transport protein A
LKTSDFSPSLGVLNENETTSGCPINCPKPELCPLSHLRAGVTARVKRLGASPELNTRLREMGLFEDQRVKLLSRPSNIICQVCNARLAISDELAEDILVEPLAPPPPPAPA